MNSSIGLFSTRAFNILKQRIQLIATCVLITFAISLPRITEAALHEYRMTFEPSPSQNAVGYTLHIGVSPNTYDAEFDLGNPPASGGTIVYALDLEDSSDLYISLRAYDLQGTSSEYSNEIRVSAVVMPPDPVPDEGSEPLPDPDPTPSPEPIPDPEPTPAPDPTPLPELPSDQDTDPTDPKSSILFFDDFEGYTAGQDPEGWLDTGAGNDLVGNEELFSVAPSPDGGLVFVTTSTETNIHSHYTKTDTNLPSLDWWNYDYVGRMRFDDASAGIGVTVLSDYPNSDSYLRLRRYKGRPSFHLAPHSQSGSDTCAGRTDSKVEPSPNTWYRFRFRTVDENGATRVLANVWRENDLEPSGWQIDCLWTAWPEAAGRPGVWSMGPGRKMWDDLGARGTQEIETVETTPPLPPDDSRPDEPPLLYAENFDGLALGSDPAGWLDTAAHNSSTVDPDLFFVGEAPDGSRALTNRSKKTNIHSHYLSDEASSWKWKDYEYSGRMLISSNSSGIGVTAYSDYPESDSYIRLRRYKRRPDFHLANHSSSASQCLGSTETGVRGNPGVWYEFRLRTVHEGDSIHVLAKVWPDFDNEPVGWQIDCVTSDTGPLTTGGAPGVWSMGAGAKFWDDLVVEPLATPSP